MIAINKDSKRRAARWEISNEILEIKFKNEKVGQNYIHATQIAKSKSLFHFS